MKRIEVIVNTESCIVHVSESAPLSHVVVRALHETKNLNDRTLQEWQLRNSDGVLLDRAWTVLDIDVTSPLFLGPSAGVGG